MKTASWDEVLTRQAAEKSAESVVIRKKEKVGKKKEGEPPYGKVENAKTAFPTFPQGLPPVEETTGEEANQQGWRLRRRHSY
jgi:hypothetical protein